MRHQKKGFKLNRTSSHRKATLASLAMALISHKRITTTKTKARALRLFVEPVITRAKEDTMHNRRMAFRALRNKHAVKELFDVIAERIGDRPGGYTRITKIGQRGGDSAEMAVIELVDFFEGGDNQQKSSGKRRRTRRGGRRGVAKGSATATAATTAEAAAAEEVVDTIEESVEAVTEIVETAEEGGEGTTAEATEAASTEEETQAPADDTDSAEEETDKSE